MANPNKVRVETELTIEDNNAMKAIAAEEFNNNRGLALKKAAKEMIKRERRSGGILNKEK